MSPADIDWEAAELRRWPRWSVPPVFALPVGVAGITTDGRTYAGCNVENAAYRVALCAECGWCPRCTWAGRDVRGCSLRRRGRPGPDALRPLPATAVGERRRRLPADDPEGVLTMRDVLPQAFGPEELERLAGR